MRPIPIVVRSLGGLGNRMFQHMFCQLLAKRIPGGVVCGTQLPEWAIPKKRPPLLWKLRTLRITGYHRFDIEAIIAAFVAQQARSIYFKGFAQRLGFYSKAEVAAIFDGSRIEAPTYGDDCLVINVRAGDILDGFHKNYCPLPFGYFEHLINESGRRPVFVGQIHDDNEYCRRLRLNFPNAEFRPPASPVVDFETIRRATHIVAAVSSFSALACWLSSAKSIYVPVAGILDPLVRPDIDLLPLDDGRYRFHRLEIGDWTASTEQWAAFYGDAIPFWRVDPATLKSDASEGPR